MHVFSQLCLQRSHHGELLAHENLGEQFMCSGEDHRLLLEVLDMGALGEELGHVVDAVASLLGEAVAGSGEDGGTHEDGHIGEVGDELLHQGEILRAVVLGRHVDLQEGYVNTTQVIVVSLGGITDEQFALGVVMFQPIFESSAYEATSNYSDVYHCLVTILMFNLILFFFNK